MQVTKHGGFTSVESADGKFLYYSKGPPGVWRLPVEGGEETLILDIPNAGGWGAWAVVADGIYFINTTVKDVPSIDFFSFATRQVKRITVIRDVNEFVSGLAVSPDHQRILYTQQVSLAADIRLVENFPYGSHPAKRLFELRLHSAGSAAYLNCDSLRGQG